MLVEIVKFPFRAVRRVVRKFTKVAPPAEGRRATAPVPHPTDPRDPTPTAAAPAAKPAAKPAAPATPVTVTVADTPNPDAKRFTCSVPLMPGGSASYATVEEAGSNALARTLIEFDGVLTVFISEDFVTVTKKPKADWPELIQVLEGMIGELAAELAASPR